VVGRSGRPWPCIGSSGSGASWSSLGALTTSASQNESKERDTGTAAEGANYDMGAGISWIAHGSTWFGEANALASQTRAVHSILPSEISRLLESRLQSKSLKLASTMPFFGDSVGDAAGGKRVPLQNITALAPYDRCQNSSSPLPACRHHALLLSLQLIAGVLLQKTCTR
jgi:hypothetical protein